MEPVERIIQAIEQAFAGVSRGTITLHEAEVLDSYGTEAERRRARALDTEDDWRRVRDSSIEACPAALSYLDTESWRFYLPAYMPAGSGISPRPETVRSTTRSVRSTRGTTRTWQGTSWNASGP